MSKLKAPVLTHWKYCNIFYIRQTVLKHSKLWLNVFIITIIILGRRSDSSNKLNSALHNVQFYARVKPQKSSMIPHQHEQGGEKNIYKRNKTQVFCFPSKVTLALLYIQQPTRTVVLVLRRDCKNTEQTLQYAGGDHKKWKMLYRYSLKNLKGIFDIILSRPD